MNKGEFLEALREALAPLPEFEIAKTLAYYGEMIDDRMEDGLSEAEAVGSMEPIDEIVSQLIGDTPFPALIKKRAIRSWGALKNINLVLLICGFPIWLPLFLTAVVLVLTFYILVWTMVIVCYAVLFAFGASGVWMVFISFMFYSRGFAVGLGVLGTGLVLSGLTMLLIRPIDAAGKYIISLTKRIVLSIKKKLFMKAGEEHA